MAELDRKGMLATSLRFATACGMSDRLRLDLVLNDFVACAITSGEISVLSDGTPWRPLIDVEDMARAILWAIRRKGQGRRVSRGERRPGRGQLSGARLAEAVAGMFRARKFHRRQRAPRQALLSRGLLPLPLARADPSASVAGSVHHPAARGACGHGLCGQGFPRSPLCG